MSRSLVLLVMLLSTVGCGSDSPGETRGYTVCGSVECQPGQYCEFLNSCDPGCTSDLNCADGQTCEKERGQDVGSCQNVGAIPGSDAGMSDLIAQCQDGCQLASFNCVDGSISAPQVAACDAWCRDSSTTDSDRTSFLACVDAAFFSPAPCEEASCLP